MHFYDYMVSFLLAFDKRFRVRVRIPIPNNALNGYGFGIHKRCNDWSLVHLVTNLHGYICMSVCLFTRKMWITYVAILYT